MGASSSWRRRRRMSNFDVTSTESQDAISRMRFPMYVVPPGDFMCMREALPHQDLKASGSLVEFHLDAAVLFVSHQWVSTCHPDPEFKQLGVLQALFRRAKRGTLRAELDFFTRLNFGSRTRAQRSDVRVFGDCAVWYDYFSVPQPGAAGVSDAQRAALQADMTSAVLSIPDYVDVATLFLVLAPDIDRGDVPFGLMGYRSWKGRGWCRMERMAHVLSQGSKCMLLATSAERVVHLGPYAWLLDPVGGAAFTAEGDKELLREALEASIDRKLGRLLRTGRLDVYRHLKARRALLLQGLPAAGGPNLTASGHARAPARAPAASGCRPAAPPAGGPPGGGAGAEAACCGPLACAADAARPSRRLDEALLDAAVEGDAAAVRGLLEARADARARAQTNADFMVFPGGTALHMAAQAGHTAAAAALLEWRASVEDRNANGGTPLFAAAMHPDPAAVRFLLQQRAEVNATNKFRGTALHLAASFGRAVALNDLMAARARPDVSAVCCAMLYCGGEGIVGRLLAARVDPNARNCYPRWHLVRLLTQTMALPHRLWGARDSISRMCFHAPDATLLHACAMCGDASDARALVRARAQLDARNARGATAADLAAAFGFSPAHRAIFAGVGAPGAEAADAEAAGRPLLARAGGV